jgi:Protein of unknown function (DUF4011)
MGKVTSIETARRRAANGQAKPPIEKLLAGARLKLIETGTRNRLIHTKRGANPRTLTITGSAPDQVYANLVRENKPLPVLAAEEIAGIERDAATPETRPLFAPSGRNGLQTSLAPGLLHKRLHDMHRGATAAHERGVNILFLALGFLRWYEDEKSHVARAAPLILLPVYFAPDGMRAAFDLKLREADVATNQALQERLRGDFGLALPDIAKTKDWRPSSYFDAVANAVASKRRWSIDANAIELGLYSFPKLAMVHDLDPRNWPGNALVSHPLLRELLAGEFAAEPAVPPEAAQLGEILSPIDQFLVVNADSAQTRIIATVRAGHNLVVRGPPGTGRSQTVTNIIAAAVHGGQTVLFVAEKITALKTVYDRLDKAGLDGICLELHSPAASKRRVAERLDRTLQAAGASMMDETARQLAAAGDRLNHAAERLHAEIGDTTMTPYRALSILIAAARQGFAPDPILVAAAALWTGKEFAEKARLIEQLAGFAKSVGAWNDDAYIGVRRRSALQAADFQRQIPRLQAMAGKVAALNAYATMVRNYFGLPQDPTLAGVKTLISVFRAIANLPRGAENIAAKIATFSSPRHNAAAAVPAAASASLVAKLRAPLAKGAAFWLARAGKADRKAAGSLARLLAAPMPNLPSDRLALLDSVLASQASRRKFAAEAGALASLFCDVWQDERTVFRLLHEIARTAGELSVFDPQLNAGRVIGMARDVSAEAHGDHLEAGFNEVINALADTIKFFDLDVAAIFQTDSIATIDLNRLSAWAAGFTESHVRCEEWARLVKADRKARAAGLASIVSALGAGELDPMDAYAELETAFATACWKKAVAADPKLAALDGDRHGELVALVAEIEKWSREAAVHSVRARHHAAITRGALGEMGVIRGEIGGKRARLPLRELMQRAARTIQKIKPVFLMSPNSVAQFLPPGSVDFDLLVIDEASQLRPEDALGLVARCRRIVVVGDEKQPQPARFFNRIIADEPESGDGKVTATQHGESTAAITDPESILSLCEARGMESRTLRWRYPASGPDKSLRRGILE